MESQIEGFSVFLLNAWTARILAFSCYTISYTQTAFALVLPVLVKLDHGR